MNLDSLVESICLTLVATQSISVGVAILCGFAIALIARGRANIPKSLKQSYTKLIWIHQLLLVLFVALLLRGFIIEPLIEEVPVTLRTAGFALGLWLVSRVNNGFDDRFVASLVADDYEQRALQQRG